MPKPRLSDESFLAHLFRPSKNPLPSGIRKTTLKGKKTHKRARLNAWNKMDGKKQETIRRAGLQESYLKGEVTLTEAKRQLRGKAVSKGIVKPIISRAPSKATGDDIYATYRHMDRVLTTDRKNRNHLRHNATLMTQHQRDEVRKIDNFIDYRNAAVSDKRFDHTYDDGVTRSLLWYH